MVRLTKEWLLALNGKAFSVCVYVCSYTYGALCARECVCVYTCVWEPEVDKRYLLSVFPVHTEAEFVTDPRAHLLASLSSQLALGTPHTHTSLPLEHWD